MSYSEKVLDHYENPRNVGSFAKSDSGVGTGMVGAPACGDVMKLQLKIRDDGVKHWKAFIAHAQAIIARKLDKAIADQFAYARLG